MAEHQAKGEMNFESSFEKSPVEMHAVLASESPNEINSVRKLQAEGTKDDAKKQ